MAGNVEITGLRSALAQPRNPQIMRVREEGQRALPMQAVADHLA